ncbi:pilus assembly protein TadG-related protein [Nocardioides terrisoli]|uniref:pilus assembly protein TadG-related protein n=1 Tax=Nocardioides terrisoli TaxID=3388267 RepID=UPI00287B68FF|nr:pilus assembly protein TadG-related protein [Nocardioides marmorisolisilvae]
MVQLTALRGRRDERGVVAVIAALSATALLLLAGLVADLGQARDVRLQAQNAADAAALAASNALYASGAVDLAAGTAAAKAFAAQNDGVTDAQWASCADPAPLPVASGTPCISYDDASHPTRVRVVIPVRKVATPIGGLAGISNVPVSATAEATVKPGGRADCGLCVIGSGIHDIQNGNISIGGASAFFNGSVTANPNGSVTVTGPGSSISIEGTVSSVGTFTPPPSTGQQPVPDPLAFLTLPPSTAGLQAKTGDACTGGPGIYYGTFGLHTCTLQPGLYVLAGSTVEQESGLMDVKAPGVTMYFTCAATDHTPRPCAAGESGAGILLTGQAALTITAPTSGPTKGLSIVADRNNTATFGFRGNGTDPSSGTIYAVSGRFDYRGNGSGAALDSLIVVGDLTFSGNNATLASTYTQEKNLGLPPAAPYLSK